MTAVRVEGISKRYRIGVRDVEPDTLVGVARSWLKAPLANYARLRDLSRFADDGAPRADTLWALRDVSFTMNEGEVLGIIGRNGAGKSTLLKVLSRIVEPTSGRATMRGRVASLLEVGTGFHPDLTGRDNVYLNGTILGMTKAEVSRKFDEIVDFSGVERFIDTPVKRYSSGMYVRLAFSVAAYLEPDVLIVDEVLAVGDFEFQEKCLGAMRNISRAGRTVLFVSHNMASIKSLCTRAMHMAMGHVAYEGTVNDTIDQYLASAVKVGADGAVPADAHRFSTGQARFTHALIVNEQRQPSAEVRYRDPIRLRLRLNVDVELRDAVIDVRVTREGIELTHSMFKDVGASRLCLTPGDYEIDAALDNPLQPGHYLLTIGIHFSNGATIDYVENALRLAVLPVAARAENDWTHSWSAGFIRVDAQWALSKV